MSVWDPENHQLWERLAKLAEDFVEDWNDLNIDLHRGDIRDALRDLRKAELE